MKKFLRYLAPFAPDHSGAVAALFELGGAVVVCDAGGCTGNICGFDEPRWFQRRSAIFSAALRDMDAILGRDRRLVEKLAIATESLDAAFTAVIGTPVPCVIATDFHALQRMCEQATALPCLAIPTNGVRLYDHGVDLALRALFGTFATERLPVEPNSAAILGATPLDLGETSSERLVAAVRAQGYSRVVCHTMGGTLEDVRHASAFSENLVVSPAGLAAALLLQERFGTPFRVCHPLPPSLPELDGAGRVLVVHQQFAANAARDAIRTCSGAAVDVATWFAFHPEYARPGDFALRQEEQFTEVAATYDVVVADQRLRRAVPQFRGIWVDFPHFAVSGRLQSTEPST